MRLYKQYPKDKKGNPGYVHWHHGEAYWFGDNHKLVATLNRPIVRYMTSSGILINGYEPTGFYKDGRERMKLQEWFVSFKEDSHES